MIPVNPCPYVVGIGWPVAVGGAGQCVARSGVDRRHVGRVVAVAARFGAGGFVDAGEGQVRDRLVVRIVSRYCRVVGGHDRAVPTGRSRIRRARGSGRRERGTLRVDDVAVGRRRADRVGQPEMVIAVGERLRSRKRHGAAWIVDGRAELARLGKRVGCAGVKELRRGDVRRGIRRTGRVERERGGGQRREGAVYTDLGVQNCHRRVPEDLACHLMDIVPEVFHGLVGVVEPEHGEVAIRGGLAHANGDEPPLVIQGEVRRILPSSRGRRRDPVAAAERRVETSVRVEARKPELPISVIPHDDLAVRLHRHVAALIPVVDVHGCLAIAAETRVERAVGAIENGHREVAVVARIGVATDDDLGRTVAAVVVERDAVTAAAIAVERDDVVPLLRAAAVDLHGHHAVVGPALGVAGRVDVL